MSYTIEFVDSAKRDIQLLKKSDPPAYKKSNEAGRRT